MIDGRGHQADPAAAVGVQNEIAGAGHASNGEHAVPAEVTVVPRRITTRLNVVVTVIGDVLLAWVTAVTFDPMPLSVAMPVPVPELVIVPSG